MEHLEIVRPLACSHSCFVSIVKVPDANSSTNQLAGSTAEPAGDAAAPTATASAADSSSAPSCKQGVAKSYRKAKLDEDETRQVELEIKLHRQLSALSPHVVPFWAALDSLDSTTILTAHCEGDLRSTLEQAGGALSEAAVREQVAAPLLEVLVHMHRLVSAAVGCVDCMLELHVDAEVQMCKSWQRVVHMHRLVSAAAGCVACMLELPVDDELHVCKMWQRCWCTCTGWLVHLWGVWSVC